MSDADVHCGGLALGMDEVAWLARNDDIYPNDGPVADAESLMNKMGGKGRGRCSQPIVFSARSCWQIYRLQIEGQRRQAAGIARILGVVARRVGPREAEVGVGDASVSEADRTEGRSLALERELRLGPARCAERLGRAFEAFRLLFQKFRIGLFRIIILQECSRHTISHCL